MRTNLSSDNSPTGRGRAALAFALLLGGLASLAGGPGAALAETIQERLDEKEAELSQVRESEAALSASLAEQNRQVNALIGEISTLRVEAAAVRQELAEKQADLDAATEALERQRRRLEVMRDRLRRALGVLRRALISIYKTGQPDMAAVVLEADGWSDLVADSQYLRAIEDYQQTVAERVRGVRDQVRAEVGRLRESRDRIEQARDAIAAREEELSEAQAAMEARHAELSALQAARRAQIEELAGRAAGLEDDLASIRAEAAAAAAAPVTPAASPPPVPGETATLMPDGTAAPPASAPPAVQAAIEAANQIVGMPYIWGGGHASFESSGYDCSGAVSYALNGGGFLSSPLDSTGLSTWGEAGTGSWVTVYANAGHVYVLIAGLRFDTGYTGTDGPSWSDVMRSPAGFIARHPPGY